MRYTYALLLSLMSAACAPPKGTLLVTAPHASTFEIFRVMSSSPLRFVAEQTASFNSPTLLAPARYLLIGDCSHTFATVKAATTTSLPAYHLVFTPPHKTTADAAFSVQCQRFATTASRQHLRNKFSLLLLTPHKKLLVGTTPLTVNYNDHAPLHHALAALRVAPTQDELRFFVFSRHRLLSATDSQRSGRWLYLLPGEYIVAFNGMRTAVTLLPGEQKTIHPAILHITTPRSTSANAYLDGDRIVPFNEPLPLPAGHATLQLMPTSQALPLTLRRGERTVVRARRLRFNPACLVPDSCATSISLYRDDEDIPFLTSVAQEIFFTGKAVRVGVEGTARLTRLLPDRQRNIELQLGRLHLQPQVTLSMAKFSDLLRLEATSPPLQGHSDDLSLHSSTLLPLLPGRYRLAHYVSSRDPTQPRQKRNTTFTIRPRHTRTLTVPVFKLKTSGVGK